jgi:Zn-dependent protease with chaperone function
MKLTWLLPIGAFLLTAGVTFVLNWFSLIPWRRNTDKHWTEQARLLAPASAAARSNLLMIPAVFMLTTAMACPEARSLWLFMGVLSMAGAYSGTLFFDHEIFPRIPMPDLSRQVLINWLVRFWIWFVFISAAVLMPDEFNLKAWGIAGTVAVLWMLWTHAGWFWIGKKLGWLRPAPERLSKIAGDVSSKMNIPCREVFVMRSSLSQAYAFPRKSALGFTDRLLEILSDDEVGSICAHELAHLTESKAVRFSRSLRSLVYMPWIFFNPLMHTFGIFPLFGLIFIIVGAPRIYSKISRKLESQADYLAKANEGNGGTYARALARIHEDRLIPAVTSKKNNTHPDLYDRLLAAGVTPDFPKLPPPGHMAWHGIIFAMLAGGLFGGFAVHLTIPIMES